jgi:hypothetical protein
MTRLEAEPYPDIANGMNWDITVGTCRARFTAEPHSSHSLLPRVAARPQILHFSEGLATAAGVYAALIPPTPSYDSVIVAQVPAPIATPSPPNASPRPGGGQAAGGSAAGAPAGTTVGELRERIGPGRAS